MVKEDTSRLNEALKETKKTMIFSGLGMSVAIVASYAVSKPTVWSWVYWIAAYVGINGLCFALNYFLRK